MTSRVFLAAVCAACLLAVPVRAQAAPADSSIASACPYDECALRIETGWWRARLLRGRDGVAVDRSGFFGGFDLEGAVGDAPLALSQARDYSDARSQSRLSMAGAYALLLAADVVKTNDEGRIGIGVAALGLVIYGAVQSGRAQRAQSRAVWEYNATLDR